MPVETREKRTIVLPEDPDGEILEPGHAWMENDPVLMETEGEIVRHIGTPAAGAKRFEEDGGEGRRGGRRTSPHPNVNVPVVPNPLERSIGLGAHPSSTRRTPMLRSFCASARLLSA